MAEDKADKIKFFERKLRNSKRGSRPYMEALIELRNIPGSGYEVPSNTEDQPMDTDAFDTKPEKSSKMKDGGMARGKGGKMYQHNYATGGMVQDHLSKVVGPPQSVQAATAVVAESPAERSKRMRRGG